MKTIIILKRLLAVSFTLLALMLVSKSAQATHLRYSTISWEIQDPAQPTRVTFHIESAWRRSYFVPAPAVGATLSNFLASRTIQPMNPVGPISSTDMSMVVSSINAAEDWLVGVTEFTHTFPLNVAQTYRVGFNGCCRISTLQNNNSDREFIVHTDVIINPGDQIMSSPRATLLPVIYLQQNAAHTLPLPSIDGSDGPSTFSFATAAQSGLLTVSPPGMTLTSDGVVSWTPADLGMYAVQFNAISPEGIKIPIDALFVVRASVPGTNPVLEIDGSTSPGSFTVRAGETLTFNLTGSDADPDPVSGDPDSVVTLASGAVPSGVSFIPSLPAAGSSPLSADFSWTPTQAQGGPPHVIAFSVTDNTGRQTVSSATIQVLTNESPVLACGSDLTLEATSAAGASGTLQATVSDPDDDTLTLDWTVNGVLAQTDIVPSGDYGVQDFTAPYGLGLNTVQTSVDDGNGGTALCQNLVNVVDTTAPVVTVPGDLSVEAEGPTTAVSFAASASDIVDGDVPVTCVPASDDGFDVGGTLVTCSATDLADNTGSATFWVNVLDTTPPVILDLPFDQVLEATGPDGAVAIFTNPTAHDLVDGSVPVTCTAASGDVFALGATDVECSAVDDHGNDVTQVFSILVQDTTAPVIGNVPANQLLEATGPGGAVATFATPTASDLVDASVPVICSAASGATFALGTTNVNCVATDDYGNAGSAGFSITVQDTTAPVITVPADLSVEATSLLGATVTYPAATAQDVVDGPVSVSCVPGSGALFALGTTEVDCSATDDAGNSSTEQFTVTVADTTAPTITSTTPSVTHIWQPNHRMVDVTIAVSWTDIDPGSSCSIVSVSSNEPIDAGGPQFASPDWLITGPLSLQVRAERLGTGSGRVYTIGVECSDGAGNTSTSSTTVSVPKNQ